MAEPPEVQTSPEQASSSSELAAVDFMSSDEEVDQTAAAHDGRFDSSDEDATPQAVKVQKAELKGNTTEPVSKRGRASEDSRFGSPQGEKEPSPANVQSADHRVPPASRSHSVDAGMMGGDTEGSSRSSSQQSDENSESSGPDSAKTAHTSAPAVEDLELGGPQSSGEAEPPGQIDDLSGTSASSGAETERHEDANSDDIGKGEPSRSGADACLPQSDEEGQEVCAEEACIQHEGQLPSAAAHEERRACGDLGNNDAERLREQHEQQVLQGKILSTLDISKPDWYP